MDSSQNFDPWAFAAQPDAFTEPPRPRDRYGLLTLSATPVILVSMTLWDNTPNPMFPVIGKTGRVAVQEAVNAVLNSGLPDAEKKDLLATIQRRKTVEMHMILDPILESKRDESEQPIVRDVIAWLSGKFTQEYRPFIESLWSLGLVTPDAKTPEDRARNDRAMASLNNSYVRASLVQNGLTYVSAKTGGTVNKTTIAILEVYPSREACLAAWQATSNTAQESASPVIGPDSGPGEIDWPSRPSTPATLSESAEQGILEYLFTNVSRHEPSCNKFEKVVNDSPLAHQLSKYAPGTQALRDWHLARTTGAKSS